jgi:hypothetical protein
MKGIMSEYCDEVQENSYYGYIRRKILMVDCPFCLAGKGERCMTCFDIAGRSDDVVPLPDDYSSERFPFHNARIALINEKINKNIF